LVLKKQEFLIGLKEVNPEYKSDLASNTMSTLAARFVRARPEIPVQERTHVLTAAVSASLSEVIAMADYASEHGIEESKEAKKALTRAATQAQHFLAVMLFEVCSACVLAYVCTDSALAYVCTLAYAYVCVRTALF
jgi:hypothetical protein